MKEDLANYDLDLNKKTPDWARRLLRMVMMDAVIAIILVAGLELSLRAFVPSTQSLIYTPELTGGHPIKLNSYGLRDHEFAARKPEGQLRVLALGNSTTFGTGVAMEQTLPQQLERIIQDNNGPEAEVINVGGQGGNITSMINFLQDQGLAFDPDIAILTFSPSMIARTNEVQKSGIDKAGDEASVSPAQRLKDLLYDIHGFLGRSYAYASFDFYVRKNLYRYGILEDDLTRARGAVYAYAFDVPGIDVAKIQDNYQQFENQLRVLRDMLSARGIPLIITAIPSKFELPDMTDRNPRNYPLDKIRISPLDKVQQISDTLAIPYLNLYPVLDRNEDLYIRIDFTHLNEKGLKIAAEELHNKISNLGLIDGG